MNFVAAGDVPLIRRWNAHPIVLLPEIQTALDAIGPAPPYLYAPDSLSIDTPCGVVTTSGERFDLAVVSIQADPPYVETRQYRLGSDIAAVYVSPYALPLPIRVATRRARELKMGSAPTLIAAPDGKLFVLNWKQDFFMRDYCPSKQLRLVQDNFDWRRMPAGTPRPDDEPNPEGVTYFVADV